MIKVAWSPIYIHPLPDNHRFPMDKYDLLPKQLLHEGILTKENFFRPNKIDLEDVLAIHDKAYWEKLSGLQLTRQEQLRSGFPHSNKLIERELYITGGSLQAAKYALEHGVAFNIAGGTHHSY
ncbi:MAG: acetoin utilization deacetylase AcuC-like enzyme, partial [Vicingaceae bacterium]